jgi:hypothetical protein
LAWILAAALAASGCATGGAASSAAGPPGADLEAVMEAIQQALSEAQLADVPGFPLLESVTLKLQTEASKSVGGEIAVYVFAIGSRYTAETASTLELTLKPAETRPAPGLRPPGELKEALARAIHLAKVGAAKAAGGTPPLRMTGVEIDLKFAVEVSGTAGAKVALVPIGGEAGGKLNRNQVHSIKLVFGD